MALGGGVLGVKYKTKTNKLPEVTKTVQMLNGKKVKIGALKGDHAWLAGIHEYGADITAENAEYLTIPVCSEAYGKRASDFKGLFVYTSKKGNLMLARNENGELKFYFWLTKSVKIPERAFLRNGHDENINRLIKQTERLLPLVIEGKKSVDDMLDVFGEQMASAIKQYMKHTKPNSPLTEEVKGSSTPLVGKTSGLIESITWKKEG